MGGTHVVANVDSSVVRASNLFAVCWATTDDNTSVVGVAKCIDGVEDWAVDCHHVPVPGDRAVLDAE